MNEREAFEKIVKSLDTIIRVDNLKQADDALSVELVYMQNIATQAIAPQEPQQKTFTVEEIKRILKNIHKKEFYDCGECTECLLAELEKVVDNEQ